MRILVAPVVIGDRICRIVSPVDSLLEVEEWVGEWWEPSSVTITTASQAPAASEWLLRERGVPVEDCVSPEPRAADLDIQTLLRAMDPAHYAGSPLDEAASRPQNGVRQRQYTGNSRFRRGKRRTAKPRVEPRVEPLDRIDLRREGSDADWDGPRRRASDHPVHPDTRKETS